MCGIAGLAGFAALGASPTDVVAAMASALAHRGPDQQGTWVDDAHGIALGHRRLAIIDPSPAGAQPMHSHSRRFAITFNGEIYNYAALRAELDAAGRGIAWRGHSDTEVLLEAIEAWGVPAALRKATGMFALALWDREARTLTLARDRMGEKPLYHGWVGGSYAFASELKALARHPAWSQSLDREALTLFLRYNCIPAPRSIWKGISKLPAGHYVTLTAEDAARRRDPAPGGVLVAREAVEEAHAQPFRGTLDDAAAELDLRLRDALRGQMISDVPLGAFLSGGIDSSAVVALMREVSSAPVKTSPWASTMPRTTRPPTRARSPRTGHRASRGAALATRGAQAWCRCWARCTTSRSPTPRKSPTFLVSRFARSHVTVGSTATAATRCSEATTATMDSAHGAWRGEGAAARCGAWRGRSPARSRRHGHRHRGARSHGDARRHRGRPQSRR
jgi:asparagine synthase (glutamine-hydrolysing)